MANVLADLFQDIADAIRTKTGSIEAMAPMAFPSKILSIPVGGGESGGDVVTGELKFTSGIYRSAAATKLLPFDDYDFVVHPSYQGIYYWEVTPAIFTLSVGTTYDVLWDRYPRQIAAESKSIGTILQGGVALGNMNLLTGGGTSAVPFLIGYSATQNKNIIFTNSTAQSHSVSVFHKATEQATVEHGLGEMPDLVICWKANIDGNAAYTSSNFLQAIWGMRSKFAGKSQFLGALTANGMAWNEQTYGIDNQTAAHKSGGYLYCPDETTFCFGGSADYGRLTPNANYNWVAISGLGASAASAENLSF